MLCWGPHRHLAAVVWTEILLRKESLSLPAHGQAGLPGPGAGRDAFGQLVALGQTDTFVLQHPAARAAAGSVAKAFPLLLQL